jgi:hypothetical protein
MASAALMANLSLRTPRERALAKMRQKLVENCLGATAATLGAGGPQDGSCLRVRARREGPGAGAGAGVLAYSKGVSG